MGVLIDTSVLIENERGRLPFAQRLSGREDEELFISVITASELLHGVHRATEAGVRGRRSAWVEGILQRFPTLPIDLDTARAHSHIWADLASRGKMIGPHDLWLAATCIAHKLTMITANQREFDRVPGLDVEALA